MRGVLAAAVHTVATPALLAARFNPVKNIVAKVKKEIEESRNLKKKTTTNNKRYHTHSNLALHLSLHYLCLLGDTVLPIDTR